MQGDPTRHWQQVYSGKAPEDLTWYQARPSVALDLIESVASRRTPVIDVGAGASTLARHLQDAGFDDLTLLDLSERALAVATAGLARPVTTIRADIRRWRPARTWGLWHDRAVLHFLTTARDQAAYVAALDAALAPDGHAVISTFALDGPERCSGLPVQRYGPDELQALVGDRFVLVAAQTEVHRTPRGGEQRFQYCLLRRR